MKVIIKFNNDIKTIDMTPYKNSRYSAKSIELFDDNTVKYTHMYDDHISIKYHKLDPKYNFYKSLFNQN